MATPGGMSPFDVEAQEIEQRRRYADALRQQSMQPLETQMAGRVAIPISWAQGAAQLLKGYAGGKGAEMAGKERADLATRRSQAMAEALKGMPMPRQETTQKPFDMASVGQDMPGEAPIPGLATQQTRTVQPTMQDNAAWLGQLAQVGPEALGVGNTLMGMQARQAETAEQRAFRQQEAEAARAARAQDLQLRLQDARLSAQQRADLQRELAQMQIQGRRDLAAIAAANRPERMMTVMGPNGEPITMPQSQAAGMTPYSPSAAKQLQGEKQKGEARQQMSDALTQLRGYYDELKSGGGIVSQDQGAASNIGARLSSSGLGQAVGGAVGTKNQEARQKIEQARPLLLNLIKNATGMSAQQMNSNAEMQLYLRAATDPTLSYEANVSALNNLDKLFGLGLGAGGNQPQTGETRQIGGAAPMAAPMRRATDAPPPGAVRRIE